MVYLLVFGICLSASLIGSICGLGGGIIIKPFLDALNIMDVSVISFLSGCTVLSMTTYSVVQAKRRSGGEKPHPCRFSLAVGAAVGGILGKTLFQLVNKAVAGGAGLPQAIALLAVTAGSFGYLLMRSRIKTHQVTNRMLSAVIGLALGLISSFLGIGGGPMNLVVLYFFFSMTTKVAAQTSLYIIFFSQLTSLLYTILSGTVPDFSLWMLLLMAAGGIGGGICGKQLNKRLTDENVDKLLKICMLGLMALECYNIVLFCS